MSSHARRNIDGFTLCAADVDALDALVDAGWDASRLPPFQRSRAERAMALLAPVDAPSAELTERDEAALAALVERTIARTLAKPAVRSSCASIDETDLTAVDRAALDALVATGWSRDAACSELAQRSAKLSDIVTLLDQLDDPSVQSQGEMTGDTLVERTLALVQSEISRSERLRRLGSPAIADQREALAPSRLRVGVRLWDVVGVAAAAALAASVLLPVISTTRQRALRLTGESRLANAAMGFSMYGQDHFGALPAVDRSRASDHADLAANSRTVWWNVGASPASHSADLFVLAKQGYTTLESLASPGNFAAPVQMDLSKHMDWRRPEQVSFSYQLFPGSTPLNFRDLTEESVLLADRSPVVARSLQGQSTQPDAGSPNQRGWGLLTLFADGAVRWLPHPILPNGDNIWLPAGAATAIGARVQLHGVERPANKKDSFVGP